MTAPSSVKDVETLIIGAGPTGIGAAWACQRDGRKYHWVDCDQAVGGLARTITADGYRWDLGGHVIHSHFEDFDAAIASAGVRMVKVRRTGAVLFGRNTFVSLPMQQQLAVMPSDIQPGRKADNLAQFLEYEMGQELCQSFFFPHNEKMWSHPLTDIDHTWTSLKGGSQSTNVPKVGLKKNRQEIDIETFPYPEGGSGVLWDRIVDPLDSDRMALGVCLVAIDVQRHIARFDNGAHIRYGSLISSVPLDQLCRMVDDDCRRLGQGLVHTRVSMFGFGFKGRIPESLADKIYIYGPGRHLPWHRATVLSNYSSTMAPEGCWNILFECDGAALAPSRNQRKAANACLHSLAGLGANLDHLDRQWSRFLDYGYPVPVLGRDLLLKPIHSRLAEYGIFSRGRFGGWRYESSNQDYSFAQGVEAVATGGGNVLWHPEQY